MWVGILEFSMPQRLVLNIADWKVVQYHTFAILKDQDPTGPVEVTYSFSCFENAWEEEKTRASFSLYSVCPPAELQRSEFVSDAYSQMLGKKK